MNKFLIIGTIIILLVFLQFAVKNNENKIPDYHFEDTYKEINFKNVKDKKTTEIFCDALISLYYSDYSNEKLKERHLLPEYMKADEIDLDDDGVNEIIGTVNLLFNEPESAECFYVLKKVKDKYECLYSFSFSIEKPIFILNSKTNNMYDIGFIGPEFWYYRPITVKFNGEEYQMNDDDFVLYKTKNKGGKILETVKFNTEKDKKAQDIFFNFILEKYKDYVKEFPEIFEKDRMYAHYVDLNGDNEPEILGFGGSTFFGTPKESDLYILQKQNEKYVDIADGCILFGSYKIEILEDKINNYHRIKYYSLGKGFPRCDAPIIPRVVGYENGEFCYRYDL